MSYGDPTADADVRRLKALVFKSRTLCGLSLCLVAAATVASCGGAAAGPSLVEQVAQGASAVVQRQSLPRPEADPARRRLSGDEFFDKLSDAAIARLKLKVRYDPAYFVIDYPGGDVPAEIGVCTDEVIRSYRQLGVDLQKEVHEDMRRARDAYPNKWGSAGPDTNIDHRRVPNLATFFARKGAALPVTEDAKDYRAGDVVAWELGGGQTHIGLVVGIASEADPERLLIVHNIGAGPQLEDVLFAWKITGHYRYRGGGAAVVASPSPINRR